MPPPKGVPHTYISTAEVAALSPNTLDSLVNPARMKRDNFTPTFATHLGEAAFAAGMGNSSRGGQVKVLPSVGRELPSNAALSAREKAPIAVTNEAGAKGITAQPTVFVNKYPKDIVGVPLKVYSSQELQNKTGRLNYVVLTDGTLIIGKKDNREIGGGHIDLARGQPVSAAGEVKFVNGQIHYIDNTSGHYEPFGARAREAAINAFERNGFKTNDKYIEKEWKDGRWQRK